MLHDRSRAARRPVLGRALGLLVVLLAASCAGGSGCGGCAEPIPGGFPRDQAILNAADVRITRPGLDFLATSAPHVASGILNLKNETFNFEVPKSHIDATVIDLPTSCCDVIAHVDICPAGANANANPPTCTVDVEVGAAKLHVDAVTPNKIRLSGTLPVRLKDLPMHETTEHGPDLNDFSVGLGAGQCNGGTPQFDYKAFPVEIILPIINETIAPRDGFSMLDVNNAVINPGVTSGDVAVCKDCGGGFTQSVCDAVFGFIKDQVFNSIYGKLQDAIKGQLQSTFCTKPNPAATPTCPNGTVENANKTQCVFSSKPDTCVPTELGTEGHIDLSSALSGISPGTSGGFNFVLAAGGAANPAPGAAADNVGYSGHTPNGLTLTMLGGAAPNPVSSCVPAFNNVAPQGIPIPDEMLKDKLANWPAADPTGPHVGIALAGRFLNYALGSVYSSGLLCLGVGTENFQQLQSGLLSALIPSIKTLTFEQKAAPVAISTRPQKPPTLKLGGGTDIKTDPLLSIALEQLAVDFYVWSDDRYVRAFTFTGDATIPVNLTTGKDPKTNPNGGLLPTLGELSIKNPVVTNNDLLSDDPKVIGDALAQILGGLSSQLTGAIKPIDIGSFVKSYGLGLTVPDGGIRKLTKGQDDFLAIFADLSTATPATQELDTNARIVDKTVHPEAMSLSTARRDLLPSLHVLVSSPEDDGTRAVEYAWAIDQGSRSPWLRERDLTVQTDYLFFQGKHVLKVWARAVGEPLSEDSSPAEAPFTIDTLAPDIQVTEGKSAGEVQVLAHDFVSHDADLVARYRVTTGTKTGEFGDFRPLADLAALTVPTEATAIDVEVRDEEGNVGSTSQALIRGRADDSLKAAGGCGCSTPGHRPDAPWAAFGALGLGLAALVRRSRRGDRGGAA